MKHVIPPRLRVEKNVVTRITRVLKGKGQLNVSLGQIVSPEEIIGSSTVSAGFRTLNLATLLSVPPKNVEKYLTRKIGQRIYKGELLAYKKGWLFAGKKVVTAPTDGILDFLNNKTGELRITFIPKKMRLPAGVYGVVEGLDSEKGQVIIRTEVSRVCGIFGSGRLRDGTLHILGKKDGLVSKEAILTEYNDHVLVGGSLFFKDTISASISIGVNGIITGGINAEDYRGMVGGRIVFPKKLDNDIGISIVVCEGFGVVPLGHDIFNILSEYDGKFVSVDGNEAVINLPSPLSSSLVKVKNTKLPPLQNDIAVVSINVSNEQKEPGLELEVGSRVRILGNSYLGEQGKVVAIDNSTTLLPSGIKTFLATLETARRKIRVPVANLEVIL